MLSDIIAGLVVVIICAIVTILSPFGKSLAIKIFQFRGITICPNHQKNSAFNKSFYLTFERNIKKAKRSIWIMGEGISCITGEEKILANRLVNAQIAKMDEKTDFKIVRVQTNTNLSTPWINKMVDFLDEKYAGRYELYFAPTQVVHACVIDPGMKNTCCTEMMMPSMDANSSKKIEVAGFGVFVGRRPQLASYAHDKIKSLIQDAIPYNSFSRIAEAQKDRKAIQGDTEISDDRKALKSIVVEITSEVELREYLKIVNKSSEKQS